MIKLYKITSSKNSGKIQKERHKKYFKELFCWYYEKVSKPKLEN